MPVRIFTLRIVTLHIVTLRAIPSGTYDPFEVEFTQACGR